MSPQFNTFWQPFLQTANFVVLDGALATELERRGADLDDPLWSAKMLVENPGLIRAIHLDYLRAGANVITSASYQASFAGFANRGLSHAQAARLMSDSVRLAREARDEFCRENSTGPRPLVAASVGCYGATRHDGSEYRGDYGMTAGQLADWHRPRFEILASSGADLLACETIPCLTEAQALLRLAAEHPHVPLWLSFSCQDESWVCHGETLAECVALTRGVGNVVAAGINCTAPRFIEPLLRSLAGTTDRPLLAYPNSGETWDAVRRRWQCADADVQDWGRLARSWYQAGATLIGGCCRTTPDTIRTIRDQASLT
jgi:homocysteine S-methyltransferase